MDAGFFEVLACQEGVVLVEFNARPIGVSWFDTFELLLCQQQTADTIQILRKATDEERRMYRVPLWIQGDDVPECCGRPMFFVGQINDDRICMERPEGAERWWHDAASFYVFTCSHCLECKAVGQQF